MALREGNHHPMASRFFWVTNFLLLASIMPAPASGKPSAPRQRASQVSATPSDPQAAAFAAQSIAALSNGVNISDVTLTGAVVWTAGSDTETGSGTLMALGTAESRMDLALNSGTRTEIRDASAGVAQGKWIIPTASGLFATQNTATDPSWFFPALGSLAGGPNVTFVYVGPETFNGVAVQHIQTSQASVNSTSAPSLSTMDFYLDATTLLPTAVLYNLHLDENENVNIPVEVDFSEYQVVGGVTSPTKIQRYLQGTLAVDLTISSVSVNTGLDFSTFRIQ